MYTKQDLIEELKVQRDHAASLDEWAELTDQIIELQQVVDTASL